MSDEEKREGGEAVAQGILERRRVIVSSQSDADSLAQNGYGVRVEKIRLALTFAEALYLVAEKRLKVIANNSEIDLPELLKETMAEDSEVWAKYVLYRDLRSRGYVVREGSIGETGLRVYERGTYPEKAAKYVVFPVREGNPVSVSHLSEVLHLAEGTKKRLIIAVIDRHGEIVYYSLTQYSPD
jgi:tRNA-intron endonuclease